MAKKLTPEAIKKLEPWRKKADEAHAAVNELATKIEQHQAKQAAAEQAAVAATTAAELAKQRQQADALGELIARLQVDLTAAKEEQAAALRELDGRRTAWQRREGRLQELDDGIAKLTAEKQRIAEKNSDAKIFA